MKCKCSENPKRLTFGRFNTFFCMSTWAENRRRKGDGGADGNRMKLTSVSPFRLSPVFFYQLWNLNHSSFGGGGRPAVCQYAAVQSVQEPCVCLCANARVQGQTNQRQKRGCRMQDMRTLKKEVTKTLHSMTSSSQNHMMFVFMGKFYRARTPSRGCREREREKSVGVHGQCQLGAWKRWAWWRDKGCICTFELWLRSNCMEQWVGNKM